jgi:hypothetical protein
MSFMVHDKHGNVWPPQFHSELCDPNSPHSMLTHNAKQMEAALQKAHAARAQGKGWGKGEIAHLVKPLIPNGAPLQDGSGFKVSWSCSGCGQSRATTAGSKKLGGVKVCAQCVAAGKAAA